MESFLLITNRNKGKQRCLDFYYDYLSQHDMWENEVEQNFIATYKVKKKLETILGDDDVDIIPGDHMLLTGHESGWNRTQAFGLDKGVNPTADELETIKNTYICGYEEFGMDYLKGKGILDINYQMSYRPSSKKVVVKEDVKANTLMKGAIMLHDFYMQYDNDYREGKEHGIFSDAISIEELYQRISANASNDLAHVNELSNSRNRSLAGEITRVVSEYGNTATDWIEKVLGLREIAKKNWEQNLDLKEKELVDKGIKVGEQIEMASFYALTYQKWEDFTLGYFEELKAKAKEINLELAQPKSLIPSKKPKIMLDEIRTMNAELKEAEKIYNDAYSIIVAKQEAEKEEQAKAALVAKEKENIHKTNFQNKLARLKALGDNGKISTADLAKNKNFKNEDGSTNYEAMDKFAEERLKKLEGEIYVETVYDALLMKDNENIQKPLATVKNPLTNAPAEHDFKNPDTTYKNNYAYEKNTPLQLRTRPIFVCWLTKWKDNCLMNPKTKEPLLDENGNKMYRQKVDKVTKNYIYDDNGNPVYDYGYFTKVPVNANYYLKCKQEGKSTDRCFAQSDNPKSWSNWENACKAVRESNGELMGIGVMLGKGLTCIDLDHCFDANGKITEDAAKIIETMNSYTEISPSGKGIHIFAFAELPEGSVKNEKIEMYDTLRFITLTGNIYNEHIEKNSMNPTGFPKMSTKAAGTEAVTKVYEEYGHKKGVERITEKWDIDWGNKENSLKLTNSQIREKMIAQGARKAKEKYIWDDKRRANIPNPFFGINQDQKLLDGDWERSGYFSQSEADFALIGKFMFYTDSPKQIDELFKESGLYREKWDEVHGNRTVGQINIESMIKRRAQENAPMWNPNWKSERGGGAKSGNNGQAM